MDENIFLTPHVLSSVEQGRLVYLSQAAQSCNALEMIANYFSPLSPVCFPAFCCLEDSFMYKSYHLHLLSGLQGKISHWVLCDENRRKETLKLRDKEFDFPLLGSQFYGL